MPYRCIAAQPLSCYRTTVVYIQSILRLPTYNIAIYGKSRRYWQQRLISLAKTGWVQWVTQNPDIVAGRIS
jgi:hypothetical protein